MPEYKTPGVYIEEISTLPASIAAVQTAIPAFIGHTENTSDSDGNVLLNVPTRITSLLEYQEIFGGPNSEALVITVTDDYTGVNGQPATFDSRTISAAIPTTSDYKMYYSLQMFFNNGGGPCWIVSTGDYITALGVGTSSPPTGLLGGTAVLEKIDEPTLLVYPDQMSIPNYSVIYDDALALCEKLKDRFVIMDVKTETTNAFTDATTFRNTGVGIDNLKYGAVYYPFLKTTLTFGYDEGQANAVSLVNTYSGAGAPLPPLAANSTTNLTALSGVDPSMYREILAELRKLFVDLAPSGAVAGVYARVDSERGVWKAPANVGVRSIVGPTQKITHENQEGLNVDATSGKSINAIREFTGKGTLVWGARTLAGNDNEWRYIPVRRLYNFIEESVKKASEFVVFEPNVATTWVRVKSMIENFLSKLWRDGALAGATTSDAFFVRIGLGETMTSLDILEGRMIIEIGLAAVRPAEFIILKFSHKLQES